VRWINIFLYSLVFFPIFGLLRSYAKLKIWEALIGAILFTCHPYLMEYAILIMSESIYIPLLILIFYLAHKEWLYHSLSKSLFFGFMLAMIPLTKDIGWIIVLALAVTFILQYLIEIRHFPLNRKKTYVSNAVSAFIFCISLILLIKTYIYLINTEVSTKSLLAPSVTVDSGQKNIMDPIYWVTSIKNHFVYLLFGSFSIFGLLSIISIFRQKMYAFLENFTFEVSLIFSILGTLLVIPLMMTFDPAYYLHDRYIAPFIFLFILPGLKNYKIYYDLKSLILIFALFLIYFITPSYLKPLTLFYKNEVALPGTYGFFSGSFIILFMIGLAISEIRIAIGNGQKLILLNMKIRSHALRKINSYKNIFLCFPRKIFLRNQFIFLICFYLLINIIRFGHGEPWDHFFLDDKYYNMPALPNGERIDYPN
jgi:hypothetical protein